MRTLTVAAFGGPNRVVAALARARFLRVSHVDLPLETHVEPDEQVKTPFGLGRCTEDGLMRVERAGVQRALDEVMASLVAWAAPDPVPLPALRETPTCGTCRHANRCRWLLGASFREDGPCDWTPSRWEVRP